MVSVATTEVEGRRRSFSHSCCGSDCHFGSSVTRKRAASEKKLRRDRRAVLFAFTSCDSKNYDCLQPPVRKVLAFMLCRLTDVRHAPSEPPAKRTLADGDQRKEPLLTEIDVNACEVRPPPAVHDCHGRRSRQKLVVVDHQLRKASQVFEEKELD